MTPNSTSSDSESAADQPGPSPGGVLPVEESVEPQASAPEPQLHAEHDEAPATPQRPLPPHAEHFGEGNWIQLPEELNGTIRALLANLQGPTEIELDEEGAPRLPDAQDEPAVAQNALALIRHLEAMPAIVAGEPHQIDANPWQQMLQTLTPEQRRVVENFENRTITVRRELANNSVQSNDPMAVLQGYFFHLEELRRTLARLPQETANMIEQFNSNAFQEIGRLMVNSDHIDVAALHIGYLLDSLPITSLSSLASDVPLHDSMRCTICLEEYACSDEIVVLPCHPTHHFHVSCIHGPNSLPEPHSPSTSI
ncbi:hypothetical protein PGTUg99_021174 [Puccinia graminis f. sp. tritici]|uniref:RING-type domain-containing protein n=1 Tax=Puccinia graminis f. sp. tritici TaxID=56615 RepID=A0A5B0S0C7_PUCGR|nr:hypothetical protein PGTUg99_021174 [Puccinia graminis f. sp. tritici]